jgi:hypothetical protein
MSGDDAMTPAYRYVCTTCKESYGVELAFDGPVEFQRHTSESHSFEASECLGSCAIPCLRSDSEPQAAKAELKELCELPIAS